MAMPDWVVTAGTNGGLGCGIAKGRRRGVRQRFRLSLRLDACAIPIACRTAHLQGALTETLGIALAGLRQHDDALGQCGTNGVVAARSSPERGQRHLERNTHLTDRFTVKVLAVEVRADG